MNDVENKAVEQTLETVENSREEVEESTVEEKTQEEVVEIPRVEAVENTIEEFLNLDKLNFGLDNLKFF